MRRSIVRGVLTSLAILMFAQTAAPHVHIDPDGREVMWYSLECCHHKDCRPVADIRPTKEGLWMTTVDGITVLVGTNQNRRPSHDSRWHICLGGTSVEPNSLSAILCVFEPPST